MEFINLTPHTICYFELSYFENGNKVKEFPPSGIVTRVEEETQDCGFSNSLKVVKKTYDSVVNLPGSKENTIYIVSGMVKSAINYRLDVIAPDTGVGAVRNEKGQIIGTTQFIV